MVGAMKTRQWTLLGYTSGMGGYGTDGYQDFDMCRHAFHEVRLTLNIDTGEWYSSTRISPVKHGTDAPFGEPRELPDAITIKLKKLMEALE